jgi:hypothetical protein
MWKPSGLLKKASSPERRMRIDAKVGTGGLAGFRFFFPEAFAISKGGFPIFKALALRFATLCSRGGIETVDDSGRRGGIGWHRELDSCERNKSEY